MHPWLLEEMGNHSCDMHFSHVFPHHKHFTIDLEPLGIFPTLLLSKMLLKGVEINVNLFDACFGITGEGSGQCYWN